MFKIYIATSWKQASLANTAAHTLRNEGFVVDCFCDASSGRQVFRCVDRERVYKNLDAIEFLEECEVQTAFDENKNWLDWADVVILILPSGRSAHLEVGYAKGCGKKLYILGDFPKGDSEVMYGFADGMFRWVEFDKLIRELVDADLELNREIMRAYE